MYNYYWDSETGGYLLSTKTTGVIKELRPVFWQELTFLEFDKKFGWRYPKSDKPLMWAETRRYFYKGELVGEAVGGGLFSKPKIKVHREDFDIEPVDVNEMVAKNKSLMDGLVQKTLTYIYDTYKSYKKKKIDIFYVAFSGGKDSIVLLDLVQRALPHDDFVVVFGDTSMELEDTYKAVEIAKRRWNTLSWHTASSHMKAKDSWKTFGPPARTIRWCCSVHKSAPSLLLLKDLVKKDNFKAMVFDGVRAEESDARATYSMVSEGKKHTVQTNCSPILEWNTSELFVYMLENNLFINEMYRKGATRVGCKLCPMASNWYECILNHNYQDEIMEFVNILDESLKKDFPTKKDKEKYFEDGGWKSRAGGRELENGENKVTEVINDKETKFIIKNMNHHWKTWLHTIGFIDDIGNNRYTIDYKELQLAFNVENDEKNTIIKFDTLPKTKNSIRFMYLFKNAFYKSAYCNNCKVCMLECPSGALKITDREIEINNCKHCESCLDSPKGCLVARSLGISGGGNNMSNKNISRYQNFGFRQEWLELFFESPSNFWENERMGKYMFVGFKAWLKEAELTENNSISQLGKTLQKLGSDDLRTWGIIYINLAYSSPIINWYVKNIMFTNTYLVNDLNILLGDVYSPTTKKNALASLKETLKSSPIGWGLGQGHLEVKGKSITAITRNCWKNSDPIVILYALYKFAENSDKYYNFTLSSLLQNIENRQGISPTTLFGIDRETLKQILQTLSHDYNNYIKVVFNKDLENINLDNNITSVDIVKLL
jgi:phosphoadenosine phosphosulfate reductase